jgi:hypothetical protein
MKTNRFEVVYFGDKTEIVNGQEVDKLIDELESFERDGISQIQLVDENNEMIEIIWTEEEGLLISYGKLYEIIN